MPRQERWQSFSMKIEPNKTYICYNSPNTIPRYKLMDATLDNLMTTALSLTPDARIILAERLLKSLDTSEQIAIDTAWAELSDQRITEIETGRVKLIPKETILQQIRDRHS
jgi:putative addiction module component (TIGR02574 family)